MKVDVEGALSVLEAIPEAEKLEMLTKARFSCESRWMMMMVAAAGWDKANDFNFLVAEAVGRGEMSRLMQVTGTGRPRNGDGFMRLVVMARELFLPKKYFEAVFERPAPDVFIARMRKCLACTKVSSLGVQDRYRCGCFAMRHGWYEAMGVRVRETLDSCLLNGDECCEVRGEVLSYGSDCEPA